MLEEALEQCGSYERRLSRFTPGSDVWRINHAAGEPVEVDQDTLAILTCAEEMRVRSGGAFNCAIGSVVELWDFSGATTSLPEADKLQEAKSRMEHARITIEDNSVCVPKGTVIDLGGIAKGFICDQIAAFLCNSGVTCGVLNFGGNVRTIGEHPKGRPWQVGLQTPSAERDTSVFAAVESVNTSVVTSGIYERAFVLDGRIYHHILDPRTCYPTTSTITSATVVCKDGMLADALTTALLIMGAEEGLPFAQSFGVEALTLNLQGKLTATPGFPFAANK